MPTPRRPRVALATEPASGGVAKHVLDLAERLPSSGFDVLLLHGVRRVDHGFSERVARHREFGYRVAPLDVGRNPGLGDVAGAMALRRAVRAFGAVDVLHGHSSKAGALSRLARWGVARRVVYTPNAFYTQSPGVRGVRRAVAGSIERGLAAATDRIIVVSRDERAHALGLGLPSAKLVLIENGIDLRVPAEIACARSRARAGLGLAESDVVVGFLGRLCAQKAPELAVRVFRRVHEALPGVRPVLVGDGPDADRVRGLIGELEMEDVVRVVPKALGRDTIPAFDVFLMSSRYEGFPYVLLEALESGCAVVTTAVGGAVDCVEEGVNGFVVGAPDDDALVEALAARVVAACGDPARLRAMRACSRARSVLFSLDRMVTRTVDVYRSLHAHA